ncbi:MAG: hypothetical protein JKX73_09965 [Flavobacteriales bacterium]|nr:hypothetical protein [Flavobacteriales bacterium]
MGLVLLVLFEIIKSKKKWGTSWAPGKYFTNNIPQFGIGIIGSYVMFYFAEQFTDGILDLHVHEDSNYYTWFALACGFNGHVIVEKLATVFKKNNPVKGSQSGYY